jgi:hypothetical protein
MLDVSHTKIVVRVKVEELCFAHLAEKSSQTRAISVIIAEILLNKLTGTSDIRPKNVNYAMEWDMNQQVFSPIRSVLPAAEKGVCW